MKHLISLISGQGKTKEQLAKEAWNAFQKYQKSSTKSPEPKVKSEIYFMPTYNKKGHAI